MDSTTSEMNEGYGHWADVFPHFPNKATRDARIFETPWEKLTDDPQSSKKKTFFACLVGGNCYGVDVIRPWAANVQRDCRSALRKVKIAANYFEQNGEWPTEGLQTTKQNNV